jgi:hypothetical protein
VEALWPPDGEFYVAEVLKVLKEGKLSLGKKIMTVTFCCIPHIGRIKVKYNDDGIVRTILPHQVDCPILSNGKFSHTCYFCYIRGITTEAPTVRIYGRKFPHIAYL